MVYGPLTTAPSYTTLPRGAGDPVVLFDYVNDGAMSFQAKDGRQR